MPSDSPKEVRRQRLSRASGTHVVLNLARSVDFNKTALASDLFLIELT